MDGEVVTFAEDFTKENGMVGDRFEAQGPYEISVSRNAIMIHRATIKTEETRDKVIKAIEQAYSIMPYLESGPSKYANEPVEV